MYTQEYIKQYEENILKLVNETFLDEMKYEIDYESIPHHPSARTLPKRFFIQILRNGACVAHVEITNKFRLIDSQDSSEERKIVAEISKMKVIKVGLPKNAESIVNNLFKRYLGKITQSDKIIDEFLEEIRKLIKIN